MKPSVTIFTPTYNKPDALWQCACSVFSQARTDWIWWIVLDDPDEGTKEVADKIRAIDSRVSLYRESLDDRGRWGISRPGLLVNRYYPLVETSRIMWLSDDDLLFPTAIYALAGAMDRHPTRSVVYGGCDRITETKDGYSSTEPLPSNALFGGRSNLNWPGFRIDWGQVMHTKKAFVDIGHNPAPLHESTIDCVDAHILNRMADLHKFYPINETVLLNRNLKVSSRNVFRDRR